MEKIVKLIAQKNSISTQTVEKEINNAINESIKNRDKSDFTKNFWNNISPDGNIPDMNQFIQACVCEVQKRLKTH